LVVTGLQPEEAEEEGKTPQLRAKLHSHEINIMLTVSHD
jgi:hypothetical protein